MLWLYDVKEQDRISAFEHQCTVRALAATTAECYWEAWLSAAKILQVPCLEHDRKSGQVTCATDPLLFAWR